MNVLRLIKNFYGFILLVFWLSFPNYAAVIETNGAEKAPVISLQHFRDPTQKLSFEQIKKQTFEDVEISSNANLGFGYTSDVIWLKLVFDTRNTKKKDWIVEIGYPLLDTVEYYVDNGKAIVKRVETGDTLPFDSRELHHRHFVFDVPHEHGSQLDLYFKIQSTSSVRIPIKIWQKQAFYDAEQKQTVLQGFYFGALISLF